MNSNNYNCLVKLAESGPVLPDIYMAEELAKLSPTAAENVINRENIPAPVMASFSPQALREFEKLSPTAAQNVINREFNDDRLDSLTTLGRNAANSVISREFPSLNPSYYDPAQARERWQFEHNYPKASSPINPATGGYRITREPEAGSFTGPLPTTHSMRQGKLPLVPSHAEMHPFTLRDARSQASAVQNAQATNEANKRQVAQNFDALFRDLHSVNQYRSRAGLPAYQPTAFDVYAPYASTRQDYREAENRALNDTAMSTITSEAARRGTPYNPAEINYMQREMLPKNYQQQELRRRLPFISPKMRAFGGGSPYMHSFKANGIQFPR